LIAAGLVGILTLSGCSIVTPFASAADEAILEASLDSLATQLEAIPGVDSVESGVKIRPDYRFVAGVTVHTTALTVDAAKDAFALAAETLSGGRFAAQESVRFALVDGDFTLFSIDVLELPLDVVPAELDYYFAVRDAVESPISLSLYPPDPSEDVPYYRSIGNGEGDGEPVPPVDWAAIRAIPDDSPAARSWWIGSVSASGGLIPETLDPLVASLASDEFSLQWNAESDSALLYYSGDVELPIEDFTALDAWPDIRSLASELAVLPVSRASLDVMNEGAVYFGECADVHVEEGSTRLAVAIARAGVDAQPGSCVDP
jgi:hypothetical protein